MSSNVDNDEWAVVTSSLRHDDVDELIERLSDVIDTRHNSSASSSNERISLNQIINFTDYTGFHPAQVPLTQQGGTICG